MNEINIFGFSVPAIFIVYMLVRTIQRIKDDRETEKIKIKLDGMSPEEKETYVADIKEKLNQELTRPRTGLEIVASVIFWGIFLVLGVGGIIGIIYVLYFQN